MCMDSMLKVAICLFHCFNSKCYCGSKSQHGWYVPYRGTETSLSFAKHEFLGGTAKVIEHLYHFHYW